jgi:hypothetical protein
MITLTGQSCWALVAQALFVYFNSVQRCQSIMTVVTIGCGPMTTPRIGRRHGSPPREQQPRTSHHRAGAGSRIVE